MSHHLSLSIAGAVERRACHFSGCETCPYSIYGGPHCGCIDARGYTWLTNLYDLADLIGQDTARLVELLHTDAERVKDRLGLEYRVLSVEQVKELSARLHETLRGLEEVVAEGPHAKIRPEWVERVRAELPYLIDAGTDRDGSGPGLSVVRDLVEITGRFLDAAVKMNERVELARYEGLDDENPDPEMDPLNPDVEPDDW